jgi:pentapeptide MXKDX repeat protein
MRRWMKVAAVALVAAVPAAGYAQTPSGDKMKHDKMMKDDKAMKDDKMKKDGKTMDKMEKK